MTSDKTALRSPERNRFFYGKVMDVRQWRMEQAYGIDTRSLLARLGDGVGVLSGLGARLLPDDSAIVVEPGVAIDPLGRTIVVPHEVRLPNPTQPTDCHGAPDGDPVTEGRLTLTLCYRECVTEPVTAATCGCDTVERCEHGVVVERFSFRLERGDTEPAEPVSCPVMFPPEPPDGFDRRRAIWETLTAAPIPSQEEPGHPAACCVVLGSVRVGGEDTVQFDAFTRRTTLYSNQALFELLLCLADRVDACCGKHTSAPDPPRVMAMWPGDQQTIADAPQRERDRWLKQPRVEFSFERPIDDAVLDDPDAWLRVWTFVLRGDEVVARRVTLTRELVGDGQPPLLTVSGEEKMAMYLFDDRYREERDTARVLVQLRPGTTGAPVVVDGSTPPLLLDGEHHGTTVSRAHLDYLWNTVDTMESVDRAIWDGLDTGATPPPLPSGEGHQGGELDAAFWLKQAPVEPGPPRLVSMWPPNGVFLRPRHPDEQIGAWTADFFERPHVELEFDGQFDENVLASTDVHEWFRSWWLFGPDQEGQLRTSPVRLEYGGLTGQPHLGQAGMTVDVNLVELPVPDFVPDRPNPVAWVMRGDVVGIDADFNGVELDGRPLTPSAVDQLWFNDQIAGRVVSGPPSIGASLADGSPGGSVDAFFNVAERA